MAIQLRIPERVWSTCACCDDNSDCRLYASVSINGARFYVEAIRVKEQGDSQIAACDAGEDRLDTLTEFDVQGPLQTVTIHGAPYVLVFCPGDK